MTLEEFKKKHKEIYDTKWEFFESYKYVMTYKNPEKTMELEFAGDYYRDCFSPIETIDERKTYTDDISIVEHKTRGQIIIVTIG